MNIGGLVGGLLPVFFVLALGYVAGKRNAFEVDQSAGLSKLALTFALPAFLFVSMTDIGRGVLIGSLARVSVQSALFFGLLHLLHVVSPFAREALVCCSFPSATVSVLFAARYRAVESEAASMLLVSTLALAITVPTILWLSH
jgi:predicted permease